MDAAFREKLERDLVTLKRDRASFAQSRNKHDHGVVSIIDDCIAMVEERLANEEEEQ